MSLLKEFETFRHKRGAAYTPRTKHLGPDGWAKYTNRLFLESSPYLLQHAHNPVNWYPWRDEAFEEAKTLNRPVLLSVGYSTCHWCHVMEEESFEDEEIARYINENYIAVKVDREERPDVDAVYMAAVQALTGRGGWPMTVWLTPDRKPFYGGTYFPARDGDRGAAVGFLTLLKKIKDAYDKRQDLISQTGSQLADTVKRMLAPDTNQSVPAEETLQKAFKDYKQRFDSKYGGISGEPKFPSSLSIRLLFRYYLRFADQDALQMATLTLDKMADSGMYDHVGGGFHRYSTDKKWLVPHFEKMLYDNALLVMDYLEAYQITGNKKYQHVVNEILRYVGRDMTSPQGAFYSATDADSMTPDGHIQEGWFFTWTPDEIRKALGDDHLYKIISTYFDWGAFPNFEDRHILHTTTTPSTVAEGLNIDEDDLWNKIKKAKTALRVARSHRPAPLRDEKILTAWNGLMISAFAKAGLVLGNDHYIQSAVRSATFIIKNLFINKRLFRSYKDGVAKHNAYLDDYAFFISALIDLYEATHDIEWLKQALQLEKILARHYEDKSLGGFFMTSDDHEKMIAREKPNTDGAIPSGNAMAIMNLLRLGELTADYEYTKRAEMTLSSLGSILVSHPSAMAEVLVAFSFYLDKPKQIVIIVPDGKKEDVAPFLTEFRKAFIPNRILVVTTEGEELKIHAAVIPLAKGKSILEGKTTAYVCENKTCKMPTTKPDEFARQITANYS